MARCNSCNGIVTRADSDCYICGDRIPGRSKPFWRRGPSKAKDPAPVTPVSNALFIASLTLTGVCFLTHSVPWPVSVGLSGILLGARIITDRRAKKRVELR